MPDQTLTPPSQPQSPNQQTVAGQPALTPEQDEKFFAALGYFAFLFVIPLIVKPKSAYCQFHAKQSMVMFLLTIIIFMFLFAIPWFGSLLTLTIFALYVLAIYRAYNGELWNIPVISNFAGKMNVEALYGKAGLAVGALSGLKEKAESLAAQAGEAAKSLGKQEPDKSAQPPPEQHTPPQQQQPQPKQPPPPQQAGK